MIQFIKIFRDNNERIEIEILENENIDYWFDADIDDIVINTSHSAAKNLFYFGYVNY